MTPLTYRLNAAQLFPAAQYEAASTRVASLQWRGVGPGAGSGLTPDGYLLARAVERERYDETHAWRRWRMAMTIAIIAGGSLPCLLLALAYRRRAATVLAG